VQTSNYVGRFGEDVVSRLLHRRAGGRIRFTARHLGDKAQLLDFIVNLVDEFGKEHGPFFFLQVRTTEVVARQRQGIRANFSPLEVKFVQARKVPVGSQEVNDYFESGLKIFVSRLTKGRKT
jgi:hypothetical protein